MHEDSEDVKEENLLLLCRFEEFFETDIKLISKHLNFWKGCGDFTNYIGTKIEDFSGWSSAKIITWLIENADLFLKPIPNKIITKKIIVIPPRVIDSKIRYEVLKRQSWKCNQCGETLKFKKTSSWEGEVAHIDHIHPYSKAESYKNGVQRINEIENLQGLCPKCNLTKGKKEVQ